MFWGAEMRTEDPPVLEQLLHAKKFKVQTYRKIKKNAAVINRRTPETTTEIQYHETS